MSWSDHEYNILIASVSEKQISELNNARITVTASILKAPKPKTSLMPTLTPRLGAAPLDAPEKKEGNLFADNDKK